MSSNSTGTARSVIAGISSMSVDPAFSFGYAAVTAISFILCAGIWSCIQ
jgi:hypothetical protein